MIVFALDLQIEMQNIFYILLSEVLDAIFVKSNLHQNWRGIQYHHLHIFQ